MRQNRVVLEETVSREDVEVKAYAMGWQLWDQQAAEGNTRFHQVYRPADTAGFVSHVEDAMVGLRYLQADDPAITALRAIADELPARDAESVLTSLRDARSIDGARLALRQTAIMAPPQYEPIWYDAIRPWFDHPHKGVRLTAVLVAAYLGWPEFRPILEHLISNDPDVDVREDARVVAGHRRGPERVQ
jgi:hypothetical protein